MRYLTFVIVLLTVLTGRQATAQPDVRVSVTSDNAIIWQPGFVAMSSVVKVGTVLDVVSRRGDWYEVVLPTPDGARGRTGMIAASQVTVVTGSLPSEGQQPPTNAPTPGQPTRPPSPSRITPATRPRADSGFRGSGQIGYGWFDAHHSFDAVIGQPGAPWFGGGAEFRSKSGVFVAGSVERFRRTGERVFVLNGDVFKLGIPDTIAITPVAFTTGYRFKSRGAVPYVGGGVGRYFYKEDSQFADPSENVDRQFTSYHVVGGVEWRGTRWLGTAVEVQYTHVPDDLTGGLADSFNEHNLGGVQARLKIVVGK